MGTSFSTLQPHVVMLDEFPGVAVCSGDLLAHDLTPGDFVI